MASPRLSIQHDVGRGLRIRMSILLGSIMLLTLALVMVTERLAWQSRLSEGARDATTNVATLIETIKGYLLLMDFDNQDEAAEDLIDGTVLKQMFNSMLMIDELVRVQPTGEIEVTLTRRKDEGGSLLAGNYMQAEWFTNPDIGDIYVSPLQFVADHPYLIISTRQRTPGNEDILAVSLSLDVLHPITAAAAIGNTGIAYIMTRDGKVVEHPQHEKNGHLPLGDWGGVPAVVSAAKTHHTFAYINIDGVPVLATADLVPGIDWIVVLEVSIFEATRLSQAALILLIATSILGWLVVRRFVINRYETLVLEPVRQLQTGADKVGGDDLTYAIPIRRDDELGEVSAAFNRMVSRLRENNQIVELQTHALTTEILERMKVEAALEVLVKDLVDANDRALESSRLKSQFLANMSHELRTPLNTILGYSGIMLDGIAGELDDHAKAMLQKIQRSGSSLLDLINDVLDLSKIEAGRLSLLTAPFSIRDAAAEWQAQVEVVAHQKGLALLYEVTPAVPEWLDGDKVRVSQIALNLLSNAIKFTAVGQVSLTVDWASNALAISVSDTGIGIPAQALGIIFDEFRQVDGSSRREYGGSGLGLAIVRRLCTAMGGQVAVHSEVDKGSTFMITLPLPVVHLSTSASAVEERGKDD